MAGRPRFKPTTAQRNRVKLLKADGWSNERIAAQIGIAHDTLAAAFATEIQFGADTKRIELIEAMEKAAKKGNASAGKWLHERFEAARAGQQLEDRGNAPAPEARPPALGKKEQKKQAATGVRGKFAPPEGPDTIVH